MEHTIDRASTRTIFLDRDGVINENRDDHVKAWHEFIFLPGALDALRLLSEQRFRIFVVTNQAAINRGLVERSVVEDIHRRMVAIAESHGAKIAALRYCPHREDERCACRKPQPGMLLSLAAEQRIDPKGAYLVGDALTDIAAGRSAGCRTVLVRTGRGSEQLRRPELRHHMPDYVADNLLDATKWIGAQTRRSPAHAETLDRHGSLGRKAAQPALSPVEFTGTA